MKYLKLFVSILALSGVFATSQVSAASNQPVDCVQLTQVCVAKDNTDLKARDYCNAKADELIQSDYHAPTDGSYDETGVRFGIYNACYVGYDNGLHEIDGKQVAPICDGNAFTQGKTTMQTDFPKICKDAFQEAGGTLPAASAATNGSKCASAKETFLTAPAWYRGVLDEDCKVSLKSVDGNIGKFIWTIAFNIVEIMLNIVAYLSVIFIIVGGFRFIKAAGSIDENQKARKTIIRAIVGFVISLMSIGIVNFITKNLG